jgi:NAD(P)-dependent dehydrogenase (short-subunit alcohol dehydrogenase family)
MGNGVAALLARAGATLVLISRDNERSKSASERVVDLPMLAAYRSGVGDYRGGASFRYTSRNIRASITPKPSFRGTLPSRGYTP